MKFLFLGLMIFISPYLMGQQGGHTRKGNFNLDEVADFKKEVKSGSKKEALVAAVKLKDIYVNNSMWDSAMTYVQISKELAIATNNFDEQINAMTSVIQYNKLRSKRVPNMKEKINKILDILETQTVDSIETWNGYSVVAGYYWSQKDLQRAVQYQKKASKFVTTAQIFSYLSAIKQLSIYQNENGEKLSALKNLMHVIELNEEHPQPKYDLLSSYQIIGDILEKMSDLAKAKEYYNKALDIAKTENFKKSTAVFQAKLANVAIQEGTWNEAEKLLKESISYFSSMPTKSNPVTQLTFQLAETYIALNQMEQAKYLLDSISIVNKNEKSISVRSSQALVMVNYYMKSGDIKNAGKNIDQIKIEYLKSNKEKLAYLNQSYLIEKESDQISNALSSFERYTFFKDSLSNDLEDFQIQLIEHEFNREQQATEIDYLSKMSDQQKALLSLRSKGLWILGIITLVLAIILAMLYRLFVRNRRQKDELVNKNEIIEKSLNQNKVLLKEIHHRVKNNLQVISSLLNLQARKVTDSKTKEALQASKSRVHSMSILHQNLYNKKDDLRHVNVKDYISNLTNNIVEIYKLDAALDFELYVDDLDLDIEVLVPIGLILNELVCNAIKHAFENEAKPKIRIELMSIDDEMLLRVKDNGIGLTENQFPIKKQSIGAKLVQSFAKRLEAKIEIDGSDGTDIALYIPKENMFAA